MAARILTYQTVSECRQALDAAKAEALDVLSDLLEQRRQLRQTRKRAESLRQNAKALQNRVEDRIRQAELLSDLIRSSPDGESVPAGVTVRVVAAGRELLDRFAETLAKTDASTEGGLRQFLAELSELTEVGKDWFDYAGVKLVYEMSELLARSEGASKEDLRQIFEEAAKLHQQAVEWFE